MATVLPIPESPPATSYVSPAALFHRSQRERTGDDGSFSLELAIALVLLQVRLAFTSPTLDESVLCGHVRVKTGQRLLLRLWLGVGVSSDKFGHVCCVL